MHIEQGALTKCTSGSLANHAKIIIDQLMWRMAAADRYSDDERVITGGDLLPLDVIAICDEYGRNWWGIVQNVVSVGDSDMPVAMCISEFGIKLCLCDMPLVADMPMRTIFETESAEVAQRLMQMYGQDKGGVGDD